MLGPKWQTPTVVSLSCNDFQRHYEFSLIEPYALTNFDARYVFPRQVSLFKNCHAGFLTRWLVTVKEEHTNCCLTQEQGNLAIGNLTRKTFLYVTDFNILTASAISLFWFRSFCITLLRWVSWKRKHKYLTRWSNDTLIGQKLNYMENCFDLKYNTVRRKTTVQNAKQLLSIWRHLFLQMPIFKSLKEK